MTTAGQTGASRLLAGQSMRAQNRTGRGFDPPMRSPNGRLTLWLQSDSNLVLYDGPDGRGRALWSTGVAAGCNTLILQPDGNLLLLNGDSRQVGWASGTPGHPGAFLQLQDDGRMVLYDAEGGYWSPNTANFERSTGTPWYRGKRSALAKTAGQFAEAVAPILSVAAVIAPFVPGVGPLAAAAILAAKAGLGAITAPNVTAALTVLGNAGIDAAVTAAGGKALALSDSALSTARGAIGGGVAVSAGFDLAVGALKHGASPVQLAEVRARLTPPQQGAFDAAVAVVHRTPVPAVLAHAARIVSHPPRALEPPRHAPRHVAAIFTKAVLAGKLAQHTSPAQFAAVHRGERQATVARSLSPRAAAWITRSIVRTAAASLKRDTAGLDAGGKLYTVEPGDSAWRIAQNLTGDGNAHVTEMLLANHPPKTLIGHGGTTSSGGAIGPRSSWNFRYLKTGEKLIVPPSWKIRGVVAGAPVATSPIASPAARVTLAPVVAAVAPIAPRVAGPVPAPAPVAPSPAEIPVPSAAGGADSPAAVSQAKAILVAWEHTDGLAAAGISSYGAETDDVSPIWGARDTLELRAFCAWANAHGSALPLVGDLSQQKLDALVAWSESKARAAAAGGSSVLSAPTTATPPAPAAPVGPVAAASIVEVIPETSISGEPMAAGAATGKGVLLLLALALGVAVVAGTNEKKKRRAA